MRFVIIGAGAIGGVLGGRLHEVGEEVVLVARGAQHEAIARHGLQLEWLGRNVTVPVPLAQSPGEIDFRPGDLVVLAVKSQDSVQALGDLAAVAPLGTPIVCMQNGVWNERFVLRIFPNVYGVVTLLPTYHLEPGVVGTRSLPSPGVLDIGRYPTGVDRFAEDVAAKLRDAGFMSIAKPDVMRWKYTKLLLALGFAIEVICGLSCRGGEAEQRAFAEGEACLTAAGIDYATVEEDVERRDGKIKTGPVGGHTSGATSSWQSIMRGTGSVQADYLNGEIVWLGRMHGVPTPVNAALQRLSNVIARNGVVPGSFSEEELLRAADSPDLIGLEALASR